MPEPKLTEGAKERLRDLLGAWSTYDKEKNAIVESEMAAFNEMYKALNLPAIILKEDWCVSFLLTKPM